MGRRIRKRLSFHKKLVQPAECDSVDSDADLLVLLAVVPEQVEQKPAAVLQWRWLVIGLIGCVIIGALVWVYWKKGWR